jgi:signal transduction histidine kinase
MARAMLHEFITAHREQLIARIRVIVAARAAPPTTLHGLENGVPLFLDQLVTGLIGPALSAEMLAVIGKSATLHGGDMLRNGSTVAHVVRSYGDVCQAVTELADEMKAPITVDEFHTLNRCLDDATAEAVTEYTRLHEQALTEGETQRSGIAAHELRNRLSATTMAFSMLRRGTVAINGSVGDVVARNLRRLTALVDRALVEVRVDSGNEYRRSIAVFDLIGEAEVDGRLDAEVRHVDFRVAPVEADVCVAGDPQILAGAIANLLDNAFKFTKKGGRVSLTASATSTRVLIDVEDECGGLPPGKPAELFEAFEQRGTDRTGLGLGLFITRKGVEASGGVLRVRDLPLRGCVFTIDLPRLPPG